MLFNHRIQAQNVKIEFAFLPALLIAYFYIYYHTKIKLHIFGLKTTQVLQVSENRDILTYIILRKYEHWTSVCIYTPGTTGTKSS